MSDRTSTRAHLDATRERPQVSDKTSPPGARSRVVGIDQSESASTSFADVFARALERRRFSLTRLRDLLASRGHQVSLTTLSYWRSGQREPARSASIEALPEIEALLGLESGDLSQRLSASLSRRAGAVEPFDELLGDPAVEAVIGEEDVCRVSSHLVVDVGRLGEIVRARVRQVVVADRGGVDGVSLFVGPDAGTENNKVILRAVAGCTIEETYDMANSIRGARLVFERPLGLGETAITEIEARTEDLDLETDYALAAEQRLEEALVWVRFHPERVPARCWVYFREGTLQHAWPIDMEGRRSVHYRQTSFGPGYLGARWEW